MNEIKNDITQRPLFRRSYPQNDLFRPAYCGNIVASASYEIVEDYISRLSKVCNQNYLNFEFKMVSLADQLGSIVGANSSCIGIYFHRKVIQDISKVLYYSCMVYKGEFDIFFLNELVRLRVEDTNRILQDKEMGEVVYSSDMDERVKNIYIKYCPSLHGNHSYTVKSRNLCDREESFTEFSLGTIIGEMFYCLTLLECKIQNLRLCQDIRDNAIKSI